MSLYEDIHEQPEILRRLLNTQTETMQKIAEEIRARDIDYIFMVARGTSDNAARYAQYLWGVHNSLPVALAAPALFTLYEKPPRLKNALVVGISQSGKSPDIVKVMEEGRRQGCLAVVLTNTADSPMAQAADYVVDIQAGEEKAVAATKSYQAELMAIAMLSQAMNGSAEMADLLRQAPGWVSYMLRQDDHLARIAERYRFMEQCVVLGRGFNYSTAMEWSLKLKELAYVAAEPYSSADFRHGPIAVISQGYPVMAVAPGGKVYSDLLSLLVTLKEQLRAELLVVSDQPEALDLAQSAVHLPVRIPEWASPLVSILPAQLFSYHLTVIKGMDPDSPRGLTKVTETH